MKTFLCFSSSCRGDIVEPLYNILTNTGLNIWYDYRCMLFGDNIYEKNFIEGIEMSNYAVIIITSDIFDRQCALNELNYIKQLNENDKIKIFPIFYNTTIDNIPNQYRGWISKSIFNTYDYITANDVKITALQVAAKLYTEILNDINILSLRDLIKNHGDNFEKQVINFCESIECGDHLIKGSTLYLLNKYHTLNSNKDTMDINLRYLLRQLIDCNSILNAPILFCMEALIRLNY